MKKITRKSIILSFSLLLALCTAAVTGSEGLGRLYFDPQEETLPNPDSEDYSLNTHLRSGLRTRRLARKPFRTLFSARGGKTSPLAVVARNRQASLHSPLARQNLYADLQVYRI